MSSSPPAGKANVALITSIVLGVAGLLSCLAGAVLLIAGASGGSSGTPSVLTRLAERARGGPPKAGFRGNKPIGLYFMTRYWMATGSLEKSVWYFAPDGHAYQNLTDGFTPEDLANHKGAQGTYEVDGDTMTVHWSDGKSSTSKIERDHDGEGFAWDMGLFSPVEPFEDKSSLVGKWEGGESVSSLGNSAAVARTIDIRADGSYALESVASLKGVTDQSEIGAGSQSAATGTWELDGYSLVLTDKEGKVTRGITFPFDDDQTPVDPDRFFFGGMMYKHL